MEKKSLTIAIPSYNVSQFLGETLDSLLVCKNVDMMEVIVVNDGSKDNTEEIALGYVSKFSGNLVIISKENGGHGSTVNAALEKATGKYFSVLDGDDWVEPDAIDELLVFLNDKDEDVIITGHYRDYMDVDKHVYNSYNEERGFVCGMDYVWNKRYRFPMTDICYKTSFLRKIGFKMQHNTYYVDNEFCTIPFAYVKTICFFSKGYYHYRLGNPQQSVSNENVINKIDHHIRVFENIYEKTDGKQLHSLNQKYVDHRLSGLAKIILRVFYTYFNDPIEGKQKGDDYYERIKKNYPRVVSDCRKRVFLFKMMNRYPLVKKLLNNIK